MKAEATPCDVTDHAATSDAVEIIVARHGALDIPMNNAAIIIRRPVETHDEWQFQHRYMKVEVMADIVALDAITERPAIPPKAA